MTPEPIFDSIIAHGRQDIDGVRRVWDHIVHRSDAAATPAAAPTRKASAMNLSDIYNRVAADIEAEKAKVEEYAQTHLPALAAFAQSAASNPLVEAAMSVVHLSPEFLQTVATSLMDAESKLAAAKQAAADAQAAQDAAAAAAAPPAEEAPADPAADPNAAMA